jgi:thiosulfate dehydrogenase
MNVQPATTLEQAVKDGAKIFAQDSFGTKQTWVPNGAFNSHLMSCAACHTSGGLTEGVTPSGARLPSLIGAASNYPKFKAKKHAVYTLERQIVHCVRAGIMGQPPGYDSAEMVDLVVYLTALSKGAAMGHQMPAVAH